MKTFASLFTSFGFLLAHWIDIRGDESMCKKFSCENNSNISDCCSEATTHLLPPQFYKAKCVHQLLKRCANESKIVAMEEKQKIKINCGISCSKIASHTSPSTNISVEWKKTIIWPEEDRWSKDRGNFILKMISHFCVNKTKAPLKCPITYRYPVFTGKEHFEKERFVCGLHAPAAYLVMKEAKYDILTVAVYRSATDLWPTTCICVAWTLISGVIIWLLDRRNNSHEFPQSFWKGVREGTWWAVVTMTTVGYGDKSPKSSSARIYAAFWMVIGVILLSIFTAEISSMLTATHTKPHHSVLNQSIGVPVGSKRYFQKEFGGAKVIEMKSMQKLREHLAGEGKKQRIVYYSCMSKSKGADRDKQIVMALKHHLIGTKMKVKPACLSHVDGAIHSLVECVRKEVGKYIEDCEPFEAEEANDSKEDCDIKMNVYGGIKDFESDGQTAIIIYASVGLVVVMFIAGSVWDLTRLRDQWKNEEGTTPKTSGGAFVFTHGTAKVAGESRVNTGFETAEDPIEICITKGE